MEYANLMPTIVAHAKEQGFIFQSSEIYDGLSAVYDYGPLGTLMRKNLEQLWWQAMVQLNSNIEGLDAAVLMAPRVWEASGHLAAFNDPMIDNKDSKRRFRADQLIEEEIERVWNKAEKDAQKKARKEGWTVGDEHYRTYLEKSRHGKKAAELTQAFRRAMDADDLPALKRIIDEYEIKDPESGTANWTEVRRFNLMFQTQSSAVSGEGGELYLRPETAQGAYVNFLNVMRSQRQALPFGIAQIGKAFRNEIIARQFIFRMREFHQMEMQFFVKPGSQHDWFEHWKNERMRWHRLLGLAPKRMKLHDHEKLAHYAEAATDIEFEMPFGFKELEGIHSRTDFDLKQHEAYSGRKLRYYDPETEASYVPYVVETAAGVDRLFLAHLCNAYTEEAAPTADGGTEERVVLKLHPAVAPVKAAVLPLVRKDGLQDKAAEIYRDLAWDYQVVYDEKDSVGRRYRRQDQRGTPYCITVDQDTMQDGTVTVRDRDSMDQERVLVTDLRDYLHKRLSIRSVLSELAQV